MITVRAGKKGSKPFHLTMRDEEILKAVYFYRYLTALDVTHLLFSLGSRKYVRDLLTDLAGGVDGANNQYLYRFLLPTAGKGNAERIYTLGSKGRDFLANDVGLPVTWYYRPDKVKHHSHRHILHNLLLTRFLVAAKSWSKTQPQVRLAQTRICYELLKTPVTIAANKGGGTETINVTPDAWLLFENLKDGQHDQWMPILLEIDRGMEYQQKFKQHVRGRIEFIDSGAYSRIFANKAVVIAYAT